jgi:hypothetical protein
MVEHLKEDPVLEACQELALGQSPHQTLAGNWLGSSFGALTVAVSIYMMDDSVA